MKKKLDKHDANKGCRWKSWKKEKYLMRWEGLGLGFG